LTFMVKKCANNAIIHVMNAQTINKLIVLVVIHHTTENITQPLDNVSVLLNIMMMGKKSAKLVITHVLNVLQENKKTSVPLVTLLFNRVALISNTGHCNCFSKHFDV